MGYRAVKGCCLTSLDPSTPREQQKMSSQIQKTAGRFSRMLLRSAPPSPSLFRLMLFRLARTNIMNMLDESWYDYRYYKEKGWFTSDYSYAVSLGPGKKLAGALFDFVGRQMVKTKGKVVNENQIN